MENIEEIKNREQQELQSGQQQKTLKNRHKLQADLDQKMEMILKGVRERYERNRQKMKDLKNDLKALMNDDPVRGSDFFTLLLSMGIGGAFGSIANVVKQVKNETMYN